MGVEGNPTQRKDFGQDRPSYCHRKDKDRSAGGKHMILSQRNSRILVLSQMSKNLDFFTTGNRTTNQ